MKMSDSFEMSFLINHCKYGATCSYNHPDRNAAIAPVIATPPAHFSFGDITPATSLLPTFNPRLTQTSENEAAESYNEQCTSAVTKLKEVSPLSLKATLQSGIHARLVDKDFAPKWDPPKLEQVTDDMIDSFFSPLGELEPELNLPIALREPDV